MARPGATMRAFWLGIVCACIAACDGPSTDVDGSVPGVDSGWSDGGRVDAGGAGDDGGRRDSGPRPDAGRPPATVGERARELAMELRGDAHFLIGMGNDLDGPPTYDPDRAGVYTLGPTLDVHYMYITGYSDRGGWATWNSDGAFVTIQGEAAVRHGVVPMFTVYQLALEYETGNDVLRDADRMRVWLEDARLLFTRLGALDRPAIVHFEPDLFGYLQQRFTEMSTTPDAYSARIRHSSVPECESLPETAASLGPCLSAIRDALAPRVRIGLAASQWGAWYDATSPTADVEGSGRSVARFLAAMGGAGHGPRGRRDARSRRRLLGDLRRHGRHVQRDRRPARPGVLGRDERHAAQLHHAPALGARAHRGAWPTGAVVADALRRPLRHVRRHRRRLLRQPRALLLRAHGRADRGGRPRRGVRHRRRPADLHHLRRRSVPARRRRVLRLARAALIAARWRCLGRGCDVEDLARRARAHPRVGPSDGPRARPRAAAARALRVGLHELSDAPGEVNRRILVALRDPADLSCGVGGPTVEGIFRDITAPGSGTLAILFAGSFVG
ncbi:MAG: hypothetical protein M5U28_03315 [Sandaracinaceae bacterium]|nr:hypothetical protein [Sandaracinaceae bacterium]